MEYTNEDEISACSDLLEVEFRVKALAYLFENLGPLNAMPLEEDLRDIHAGIGKLVWDLAEEICDIRRNLEDKEIKKAQEKKKSKLRAKM